MKFGAVSVAIVACATVVSAGKLGTTALTEAFNVFVKTTNVEFKKINYEELYNALDLDNLNEKGDRLKVDFKLFCSDDLKGENKGKETHITEFKFEKPIWKQVLIWHDAIRQRKILQGETHLWNLERIEEVEMLAELKKTNEFEERRKNYYDLTKTNLELDVANKPGEEEKDRKEKGTVIGDPDAFWTIADKDNEKNRIALHLEHQTKDEINKLKAKLDDAKMESWNAYNWIQSVKFAEDKKKEDADKKKEDEDKKKEDEDKKTEDEEKDGDRQEDEEKEIVEEVPEAGVVIENITATLHCTPDGKVPKPGSGVARPSTVFAVVAPLAAAVLMMA